MGLFDNLLKKEPPLQNAAVGDVFAAEPINNPDFGWFNPAATIARDDAMQVPTVARIRNIICSTVASLPIEVFDKASGARVSSNRVINQPDPRVPGSYVFAWLAEDLLFNGIAYAVVTSMYNDGRIAGYTRVKQSQVTPRLNEFGTEVVAYELNGRITPKSGVGSIITFWGLDEGLLYRAGRTIRAAHALEMAALTFAKEPVPQMVLKSTGAQLTQERVKKVLDNWNKARINKATAFLNADVDLKTLTIDPKNLQLNEARQYLALELSRAVGAPASFISAETTSMTYSNMTAERKALLDFSLRPVLTAFEQRLNMPDFTPSTQEVRYSYDDLLRGSAYERAQVYQILHSIQDANGTPVIGIEEIRREEDLVK